MKFKKSVALIIAAAMAFDAGIFADVNSVKALEFESISETANETSFSTAKEEVLEEITETLAAIDNVESAADIEANEVHINAGQAGPEEKYDSIYDFGDDKIIPQKASYAKKYIPELSQIPHLRNQNPLGTCYSFATIGAIEANMIKNGMDPADVDYSELALAYFTTHTVNDPLGGGEGDSNRYTAENIKEHEAHGLYYGLDGGNPCYTSRVIASWTGATDEAKAPYTAENTRVDRPISVSANVAFDDVAHVKNFYSTPVGMTMFMNYNEETEEYYFADGAKEKFLDGRDTLKGLIEKCGGATLAYGASEYIGSDGYSYYNHVDRNLNHFVTVIGWDDDYSKDKFDHDSSRPEGNGAWLCKNSWSGADFEGTDVYDNLRESRLFWISYYDTSIIDSFAFEVEPADNYDNNYQYDLAAYWTNTQLKDSIKVANMFEAKAARSESLKAVSFITNGSTNMDYTVNIYRNPVAGNPESGELIEEATTTGSTSYVGYYTVPLAKPVELELGDTFAVVIELSKLGGYPGVAEEVECDGSWYESIVGIKEGQSFVYDANDDSWDDIVEDNLYQYENYGFKIGNLCIKAFTDNTGDPVSFTESNSIIAEYKGATLKPGQSVNPADFDVTLINERTYLNNTTVRTETLVEGDELGNVSVYPDKASADSDTMTVYVNYQYNGEYLMDVITLSLDTVIEGLNLEFCDKCPIYDYSGQKITPAVNVYYDGVMLTPKVDYTISYKNNINAAGATDSNAPTVIVKGKGDFAGTIKATFDIVPIDIAVSDNGIQPDVIGLKPSRTAKTPVPTLMFKNKKLGNKDRTLTYLDKDKKVLSEGAIPANATGTYYVHVKGTNNFCGEIDVPVNIGASLMSAATVSLYENEAKMQSGKKLKSVAFSGNAIYPIVSVKGKVSGTTKELVEDKDYTVLYLNNDKVGTATVIITGIAGSESGFVGTKRVTFKINGISLSKAVTVGNIAPRVYTGSAAFAKPVLTLKSDSKTNLKRNVDYVLEWKNNVNKGVATVTAIGIGNYTGRISRKFNIMPVPNSALTAAVSGNVSGGSGAAFYYEKGGVKPDIDVRCGDRMLVKGRDYTVTYKNHTTLSSDNKKAVYTVKLKGNYIGTLKGEYVILPARLENLPFENITASDIAVGEKVSKTKITVTDVNGKVLQAGVDYDRNIRYFKSDDLKSENEIDKNTVIDTPNQLIYAYVEGKNNYDTKDDNAGVIVCFRATKFNISKANAKTIPQIYTGKEINPGVNIFENGKDGVTFKMSDGSTKTLVEGTDYVVLFKDNVRRGRGKAILVGRGDFGGVKVLTFTIGTHNLRR